jgi:hypothetical protein
MSAEVVPAAAAPGERPSGEEWRLLCELRQVPPGALRDQLLRLLLELTRYVREPRCPDAQADGVPCSGLGVACDQCRQLELMLDELRAWVREV